MKQDTGQSCLASGEEGSKLLSSLYLLSHLNIMVSLLAFSLTRQEIIVENGQTNMGLPILVLLDTYARITDQSFLLSAPQDTLFYIQGTRFFLCSSKEV